MESTMEITKEKILDKHPCMLCLVKSVCGMNLCEKYRLYYRKWSKRTHRMLQKEMWYKKETHRYDTYFCIMAQFINVPGMRKRILLSQDKLVQKSKAEAYFRQMIFIYFGASYNGMFYIY